MKNRAAIPWIAAAVGLAAAAAALLPTAKVRGLDLDAFGRLPALEGGRIKPIDSIARNSLLVIRGQQSLRHAGQTLSADEWLLDVMLRPDLADQQDVFVINDPDILGLLGIQQSTERYFSFRTMQPKLEELEKQGRAAQMVDSRQRSRFQDAIVNLYDRLLLYHRLRNSLETGGGPALSAEIAQPSAPGAAVRRQTLAQLSLFRPLPFGRSGDFRNVGEALSSASMGVPQIGLPELGRLSAAYAAQDAAAFNQAAADLRAAVAEVQPGAVAGADHELLFNRAQPFYLGMILYVLALLAVFGSWLKWPEILRPAAFGLVASAAIVHTVGLVSRTVLQGRPPVTNLYSSAVFVGWAAVIVAIVLERMYRRGFGTAAAAASGFASLIVAHHLAADGDTMEMMRAVLDSNFWLATHVVTITIGYSGTFLAGALAIAWGLRRQFARRPDPATDKALVGMAYGVVCFALFFSFVGTVLGGIWADQSWGRFWGWDPKENGALLIVLWNAFILHARWGGYARDRGLMSMTIFGNVITSLSWFGVNMLGVGLHSYGFMNGAFYALSSFIGVQLVLSGLCLLPAGFFFGRWGKSASAAAR